MCYRTFFVGQGFGTFISITSCSIRHVLIKALLQQFHAKIGTFHLRCRDNVVLLLDWCRHKHSRRAVFEVSPKDPWEVCLGLGWTMVEGVNGVAT